MSTTQQLITRTKDFNPSALTYGKARLGNKGGKTIPVLMNGHNLVLQFPLVMTWGVNEWDYDDSDKKKYDLNLQFGERSADLSTSEGYFFASLKKFQEKVLNDSVANSKEWFGKSKMSKEVAEALMYPILKYPKDKESGEPDTSRYPNVKLKIPCWDNVFKVELYDMNKNQLFSPKMQENTTRTPVDLIEKRAHLKGLMECTGVWHAGGKFGVTWKLVQAQVRPPVRIQGFCIMDDSDDEDVETAVTQNEMQELGETAGQSFSSDEEEEKPKPKTKPKKKRKKVVRATK
jgi:hypothetical protein